MTAPSPENGTELVALFADRDGFENAVNALLAAGFERPDLSVLASHESLDAAGRPGKPWREALPALLGELKYEGPLVASGAIVLAGGATAALMAGIIGTAVGGLAVRELLEEVTAKPHREDFARSLQIGSVILWVRAETDERRALAQRLLHETGGSNVHEVAPAAEPTPDPDPA